MARIHGRHSQSKKSCSITFKLSSPLTLFIMCWFFFRPQIFLFPREINQFFRHLKCGNGTNLTNNIIEGFNRTLFQERSFNCSFFFKIIVILSDLAHCFRHKYAALWCSEVRCTSASDTIRATSFTRVHFKNW